MRASSDPRFPATIYYAFKQTEDDEDSGETAEDASASRASTGWETFLQGLADAGWQIDGTWPMRTERSGRLRDNASNALASSIVLVCRPRLDDAGVASRRDFLAALKRELPEALRGHKTRLYGLTIAPERLHEIRKERRPGSRYAELDNCRFEVEEAETMMRREGIRSINSTTKSIEEIATTILRELRIQRQVY